MAKFTVDEFVIELGFSEKVMKGLEKVEKQVLPVAKRIEKSLNKAFQVDASKQTQPGINRMVKNVEAAGKKINRTLTTAFNIKNLGRTSIKGFESEGNAAARRLAKEMQKAFKVNAPRGLGGTGGRTAPGGGGGQAPRGRGTPTNTNPIAREDAWMARHNLLHTTNGMTNSMTNLGMSTQRESYISELNRIRDKYRGTGDKLNYEKEARQVIFGYKQQVLAQKAAIRAQEQSKFMQQSLTDSTMHLVKGFASVYTALEFFKGTLEEGIKRTQAGTMMSSAYDGDAKAITMAVDKYADRYGMDKADARQQAAQLRMTLPEQLFSNQDIPKLLETESVFAHQTGMSNDAVGRLNYAMQQIATSAHLMGQDWMQVVNASPALIRPLEELTSTKSVKELKEKAKTMSGADFAKLMVQAMERLNNKTGAAIKAQQSLIAAQGRLNNAVKDGQEMMFRGMENGVGNILDALTQMTHGAGSLFMVLGNRIGWIANKLRPVIWLADQLFANIGGHLGLMGIAVDKMRKQSPVFNKLMQMFDSMAGLAVDAVAIGTLFTIMKSLAPAIGLILQALGVGAAAKAGATIAGGEAAAAVAGGLGVRVLSFANGLVLPVVFAKGIIDGLFSSLAYDKDDKKKSFMGVDKHDVKAYVTTMLSFMNGASPIMPFGQHDSAPALTPMSQGTGQFVPQRTPISFAPLQITITNKGEFMVKNPDGSMQQIAMEAIRDQHESVMMTAQGLGGQWQTQGQSAGWNPSFLMKQKTQG